jgi:hypothetical protein
MHWGLIYRIRLFGQSATSPLLVLLLFLKGSIMFKKILGYVLAPISAMLGFVPSAFAALPSGVADAVATATADGVELGGLLLGMAVIVGVIFWLKRKV